MKLVFVFYAFKMLNVKKQC